MALIKLNNKAVSNATAFGSISSLGSMTFIKKLTASSSATLSFVDGSDGVVLDDTYKEYVFTFNNIHPSASSTLVFQVSTDGGSSYATTLTSTTFRAYHSENGSLSALGYDNADQANGTAFQDLLVGTVGTDNDHSAVGTLHLFNPSSTTFAKHYIANTNCYQNTPLSLNGFSAGYFNTTSAVNAVRFQMSSGNIDAGDICLYGIA
jgi:hypothetical protein